MIEVGISFLRINKSQHDDYVESRYMGADHIGLSFMAPDVEFKFKDLSSLQFD